MNFLENIAIPQSAHHIELLYGLLILTFILFIPYLALVNGALMFSLYFNRKGKRTGEKKYFDAAKRLIDIITFNKSISLALGIIPLLSIIFSYAQILQGAASGVPEYLIFTLILLLLSLFSLYTYKYSFHLKDLLENVTDAGNEAESYKAGAQRLFNKAGKYSFFHLFLTAWLFFGSVTAASDSSFWEKGVLSLLFSWETIFNLLGFITLSFFVTSVVTLYVYYRPNAEIKLNEEENDVIRNSMLKSGLATLFILPVFILSTIVVTSPEALNESIFVYSLLAVLTLLFIGNFIYLMIKKRNVQYVNSVLFLALLFVIFIILKDQSSFETSSRTQFVKLSSEYQVYKVNLQKKFGAFKEKISGVDIFKGRCAACHAFDRRIVGPAYNSVLEKYDGKPDDLANFVLNPKKVNPNFPVMPNPGLKPNEAKAVAEYILSVYKQNNP